MDGFTVFFFAMFALVAGSIVFRFVKFGGIRAAMFGARIERTVGEATGSSGRIMKNVIRVHVLGGGPERTVGLELVARSFASYQVVPVALSDSEARNLAQLLQAAASGPRTHST